MSSHRIPPGELSDRIAKLRDKVSATLKAREERLAKEKGPQLPSFTKKIKEEKDHEYSMARSELHKIDNAIKTLRKKLKGEGNLEAWVQSKITRASDYLDSASNYVDSGEHDHVEESYDDNTPELRSRTVSDSPTHTPSLRKGRKSPGELMRMLNQDTPKPKKKKKGNVTEETMSSEQKAKEKKLKAKYDDSDMKQNMIDQYGEEKGTQIYFAKIRKMAMDEEVENIDEQNAGPSTPVKYDPHMKQIVPNQGAGRPTNVRLKKTQGVGVQMADFEFEGETLEERKLSRTAKRAGRVGKPGYDAEGKPKPKGKVRAWDMDETLMRNDPKKIRVHVKDKEGKKVQSLTNQEFNTHKLDKDKGHSYDFDEFRSSEKFAGASKPNKSMVKKLKKQVRRGKPVHIVTARGSFDDQPKFAKHLRRQGIEIDPGKGKGGRHVHVHRAGDMPGSDIGEKKVKIVKDLMKKQGTSGAEMYDDAAKVHRAFKKSAKETPTQPKVKTKMVQPNKKDTTQARSFKDDLDFENILDMILEGFIDQGIVESYEEGIEVLESISTDDLYNAISESTNDSAFKVNYVSNYASFSSNEVDVAEDNEDETPYGYWKNFINDVQEEIQPQYNQTLSKEELDEEVPMNSYQKWKSLLSNNETSSK